MKESQKEDWKKMIPNPGVGVPYIYAYAKFNQELKKLEELEKQNKLEQDLSKDSNRDDDLSRFESWLFWDKYVPLYSLRKRPEYEINSSVGDSMLQMGQPEFEVQDLFQDIDKVRWLSLELRWSKSAETHLLEIRWMG